MSNKFIITGTDTEIGKTVCSAMLTIGLRATYWKPIQSGVEDGTDTKTLQKLGVEDHLPEKYILNSPLSPHRSAEIDGVEIDVTSMNIPESEKTLIIEGAGGLMVPVTREILQIDIFKKWNIPVILCCRTGLGTINHSLLSIEAMRARDMKIHGLIFIGEDNPDNIRTIHEFSGVKVLGHIPWLDHIDDAILQDVFDKNFTKSDFE